MRGLVLFAALFTCSLPTSLVAQSSIPSGVSARIPLEYRMRGPRLVECNPQRRGQDLDQAHMACRLLRECTDEGKRTRPSLAKCLDAKLATTPGRSPTDDEFGAA